MTEADEKQTQCTFFEEKVIEGLANLDMSDPDSNLLKAILMLKDCDVEYSKTYVEIEKLAIEREKIALEKGKLELEKEKEAHRVEMENKKLELENQRLEAEIKNNKTQMVLGFVKVGGQMLTAFGTTGMAIGTCLNQVDTKKLFEDNAEIYGKEPEEKLATDIERNLARNIGTQFLKF